MEHQRELELLELLGIHDNMKFREGRNVGDCGSKACSDGG